MTPPGKYALGSAQRQHCVVCGLATDDLWARSALWGEESSSLILILGLRPGRRVELGRARSSALCERVRHRRHLPRAVCGVVFGATTAADRAGWDCLSKEPGESQICTRDARRTSRALASRPCGCDRAGSVAFRAERPGPTMLRYGA